MSTEGINSIQNLLQMNKETTTAKQIAEDGEFTESEAVREQETASATQERSELEQLSNEEIEELAKFLNDSVDLFNISIHFELNQDIDRVVVQVTDKNTGEIIRQIPSDELIALAERLNEMVGVLFNETA